MADTIIWTGASGKEYQYWIYPLNTTFDKTPGELLCCKGVTAW